MRVPSRQSALARGLEPLAAAFWPVFVVVSVLVGVVWTLGIGEASLEKWISNRDLRTTLVWLLARLDLGWVVLAAVNTYSNLAAHSGLTAARRSALVICGAVIAMAWVSAVTTVPLGAIRYGAALGKILGPVPLGLPFLWFSIIIGARDAAMRFFPRAGQVSIAWCMGLLALLTDLNLEPLAAQWRGFWFWSAAQPNLPPVFDPPLLGSLAWGALAVGIALLLREQDVVASAQKPPWQTVAILGIFNAVFLASHVAYVL